MQEMPNVKLTSIAFTAHVKTERKLYKHRPPFSNPFNSYP